MELPLARLAHCPRCGLQFLICSHCDRGQRYCGPACARAARRASVRAAGRRYQQTQAGRQTHAARQRRSRARLREKVTHQGSPPVAADGAMPTGSKMGVDEDLPPAAGTPVAGSVPAAAAVAPSHCRFCGRLCAPLVRQDFLRHRRAPRTIVVTDLRGAIHDPFP